MFKKVAKAIGNRLVQEVKGTLSQDSNMPGDWITPMGKMGIGATMGVIDIGCKIKSWSTEKKCIRCRATPTCPDCKKCGNHCSCPVPEAVVEKGATEYECPYCLTMQPITRSQCANCHGPRPSMVRS